MAPGVLGLRNTGWSRVTFLSALPIAPSCFSLRACLPHTLSLHTSAYGQAFGQGSTLAPEVWCVSSGVSLRDPPSSPTVRPHNNLSSNCNCNSPTPTALFSVRTIVFFLAIRSHLLQPTGKPSGRVPLSSLKYGVYHQVLARLWSQRGCMQARYARLRWILASCGASIGLGKLGMHD